MLGSRSSAGFAGRSSEAGSPFCWARPRAVVGPKHLTPREAVYPSRRPPPFPSPQWGLESAFSHTCFQGLGPACSGVTVQLTTGLRPLRGGRLTNWGGEGPPPRRGPDFCAVVNLAMPDTVQTPSGPRRPSVRPRGQAGPRVRADHRHGDAKWGHRSQMWPENLEWTPSHSPPTWGTQAPLPESGVLPW